MDNKDRANYGAEGVAAGQPDHDNAFRVQACDAIANILHAVAAENGYESALVVLNNGEEHFKAEWEEEL